MEYKYTTEKTSYSGLASGHVFYGLPGHPAFPIRLASEIYQRCLEYRGAGAGPCTLFDPCCGAAYHLSIIAYLHWDTVCRVVCSDIDEKAVQMAERNLGLLTPAGMERRSREISAMVHLYGKSSHKDALESLRGIQEQVNCLTAIRPMQTHVFRSNATDPIGLQEGLQGIPVDIVFTDIPYGQHSRWQETTTPDPANSMLEALRPVLKPSCLVAISSDKAQRVSHEAYHRLEKFQVGKRLVQILKLT